MPRIKVNSRVSTEAWRFDRNNVEEKNRWSYSMFGEKWRDGRVYGTVVSKEGEKWMVKWDLDSDESALESEMLYKESDQLPIQIPTKIATASGL